MIFLKRQLTPAKLKYELIITISILSLILLLPIISVSALIGNNNISLNHQLYTGPIDPSDHYAWGNCTYWVYLLRQQIGQPIPNTWGNANTWAKRAAQDGYIINHTPSVDSIMQTTQPPLGHVAFVIKVNPINDNWTISEMNVYGLDVVDQKTLTIKQAKYFNFIHNPPNIVYKKTLPNPV